MLILNADAVRQSLPMDSAITAMRDAFAAFGEDRALVPQRTQMPISDNAGASLIMPVYVGDANPQNQALTIKVVSLFDDNPSRNLARIQSAVLVMEPDTGRPLALLEGGTLTALRTAAASGLATDLLARPLSSTLAILGSGVEARSHLVAMCKVRPIVEIRIYSRSPENVQAMIDEVLVEAEPTADVRPAASPAEAIRGADIVCCTTSSKTPVFDNADLDPGTHVNAVGSYTPDAREVPPETVARSLVVVDSRDAAWEEAGDLIQPLEAGIINRDHLQAELGDLVLDRRPGRTNDEQITFFKSVGLAVQDAFAARVALHKAQELTLGQNVKW